MTTTVVNSSSTTIDFPSTVEGGLVIAMGHTHQGDERYSEVSCGRQCAFMALTSLVYNFQTLPTESWGSNTIDRILMLGDCEFSYALHHGYIPDAPNLSVENLPRLILWHGPEFFFAWNDVLGILNNISDTTEELPAKEHTVEANFTKELPIEANLIKEPPFEANFTKEYHSDFFIAKRYNESPSEINISDTTEELPAKKHPVEANFTKEVPIEANFIKEPPIEANFTKEYHSDFFIAKRYNESPSEIANRSRNCASSVYFGSISQGSFFNDIDSTVESPFVSLHTVCMARELNTVCI
eukprot:gene18460-20310_t